MVSDTITVPFVRVVFSIVADWIIADMLAIRQNALGHVRYVLKDGLKWLPLYGWYFSQVDLLLFKWFYIQFTQVYSACVP